MAKPFITFYTPTYRRPQALARCLASVSAQTAVQGIEHIVIPDHVGRGVAGMYAQVPLYAPMTNGQYVHLLADDDQLASPTVVEELHAFAEAHHNPDVILVQVQKSGMRLPIGRGWPPVLGQIDLGCLVTRGDLWRRHAGDYGKRYEGDFDFADVLWAAGYQAALAPILFLSGDVRRGAPEAHVDTGADVIGGGAC